MPFHPALHGCVLVRHMSLCRREMRWHPGRGELPTIPRQRDAPPFGTAPDTPGTRPKVCIGGEEQSNDESYSLSLSHRPFAAMTGTEYRCAERLDAPHRTWFNKYTRKVFPNISLKLMTTGISGETCVNPGLARRNGMHLTQAAVKALAWP